MIINRMVMLTMQFSWLPVIVLLMSGVVAAAESITGNEPFALKPVDQAVEDLDPLSAGLRHVDPGNALFSDRVSLYQPLYSTQWPQQPSQWANTTIGIDLGSRYQYRMQGMQAFIDQPEYISQNASEEYGFNFSPAKDGQFIEIIPANTIFNLIPEHELMTPTPIQQPYNPYRLDTQLDGRLDLRIDSRIDLQSAISRRRPMIIPPYPTYQAVQNTSPHNDEPETNSQTDTEPEPVTEQPDNADSDLNSSE